MKKHLLTLALLAAIALATGCAVQTKGIKVDGVGSVDEFGVTIEPDKDK